MLRRRLLGPQPLDRDFETEPDHEPEVWQPDDVVDETEPTESKPTMQSKEANVSQRPESIQPLPRSGADQTVTVIGNGARLEGNLIAAASLRIEGSVKGTITAEGDVIVAPEAEVAADIQATNATLGGRYTGNVVASGTIELTSTARVEGNLTCKSLVVNQGAMFTGQSIMGDAVKKPAAGLSPVAPVASNPSSTPSSPSSPSSGPSPTGGPAGSGAPGGGPKPQ